MGHPGKKTSNVSKVGTLNSEIGKPIKTNRSKPFVSRIKNIEYRKQQVEMQISNIKSEEQEKRKKIVKETIKSISSKERQVLEKDFEIFLEQENNKMTEEFRKYRWDGLFISVYFDSFLEEKIYTSLFGKQIRFTTRKDGPIFRTLRAFG